MDFKVRENSPDGTVVGTVPASAQVRILSNDRNGNGVPAFTVGADSVIRVTDSSELDFDRLFSDRNYSFLIAKDGADDILTVTVEDIQGETFLGTAGNDVLRSGFGSATLTGFGGNDQLTGTFEIDTLIGGAGIDTLTGDLGSDLFVFDAPIRSGADVITDFTRGGRELDRIVLDRDIFTKLKTKKLSFAKVKGAKAARLSKALVVYDSRSGSLFYNSNAASRGFGSDGGKFAQLSSGLPLSIQSFLVQN
ncbi:MAG: hypothetical protein KME15_01865 [Drouetiella hepatica Uher 2000/2452]|jgi:Ca2+-binding RTX toxin-like protein|uniref:Calcium-binding protein n=1 Tax=Drouetiella hepatica Uher 2000/2452 TaxID=904376 RepID=A0A951Q6R3_9CYAN|nr:hypothetical protein [Drouetiella hepatica Uher 2000/2452]